MGYVYNNSANKIKVHNDDEKKENEHIKMYGEDENNSLHKNKEDEDKNGDKTYCVIIALICIIF